jgi:hypothetical protein
VFCKTYFFVKSLWFYSFLFWYDLVKQAFFYIRKFKKKLKFIDLFMGSFHFFPDCFVLDISLHISSIDFHCEMQLRYTIHFFSFFLKFFFKKICTSLFIHTSGKNTICFFFLRNIYQR